MNRVKCGKCDKIVYRTSNSRVTYCQRCTTKRENAQKIMNDIRNSEKWAPCGHGRMHMAEHDSGNKYFYRCQTCDKKYTKQQLIRYWRGKKR